VVFGSFRLVKQESDPEFFPDVIGFHDEVYHFAPGQEKTAIHRRQHVSLRACDALEK
jgi:hypothetical protein